MVTADAWTNDVVGHLGLHVPLEVTLEQVTYFAAERPEELATLPLWIWMDDPSFYGFPPYGEPTIKAAQDCGGPRGLPGRPHQRAGPGDGGAAGRPRALACCPGVGAPLRSVRCQYTLTPDRDFVLAPVPGHERVVVGLGAAHGFKFVPTFGRLLADLVTTGDDGDRRLDVPPRPAGPDRARLRRALAGAEVTSVQRLDVHTELDRELRGHPAAQLLAGDAAVHHRGDGEAVDQRGQRGPRSPPGRRR